jgi:hypothetical protein
MTPERLAEIRKDLDYAVAMGQFYVCHPVNVLSLLDHIHNLQAELSRLRRVEEAARAMLGSRYNVEYDECLADKLQEALDGKGGDND